MFIYVTSVWKKSKIFQIFTIAKAQSASTNIQSIQFPIELIDEANDSVNVYVFKRIFGGKISI